MKLKLLQLNIYKGMFIDNIVKFANKNDFDILCFQEVSGGSISYKGIDCYSYILESLGPKFDGRLTKCWKLLNEKGSYFGNAVFFKKELNLIGGETIWLKPYKEIRSQDTQIVEESPRCAMALKFNFNSRNLYIINTHLAWGKTPEDKPYKLKQARKLYDFTKTLKDPFVLCGDFNVSQSSRIISWFNAIAQNLIAENDITNTLNIKVHRVKSLFPKGLAVDYVFTSPDLEILRFGKINETLSDHLGLIVEFKPRG